MMTELHMPVTKLIAAMAGLAAVLGVGSAHAVNKPPRETQLAGITFMNRQAYQYLLNYFGNPSRIEIGSGDQPGGFNVFGFSEVAPSGGGASGGMMGSGSAMPSSGSGSGGGGGATPDNVKWMVTWVYENPRGARGDTLMVTFDEQDAGAAKVIRLLGRFPTAWHTSQGIGLGSLFNQVLMKYGYPDMTVRLSYDNTALYYFHDNVVFGFEGNGQSMRVTSITIGPGAEPAFQPEGQGGVTTSAVAGSTPSMSAPSPSSSGSSMPPALGR